MEVDPLNLPGLSTVSTDRFVAAALSAIAGMVDVIGWVTLSGLFTAHITGNLVIMAAYAVDGRSMHAAQILAVPVFFFITGAVSTLVHRHALSMVRREKALLLIQAAFLVAAAAMAIAWAPSAHPKAMGTLGVAMLAVSAMASQNALLHLARERVPTTAAMTGNIVTFTLALMAIYVFPNDDRPAARKRFDETWPILVGFGVGCLGGSVFVFELRDVAWSVPAVLSVLLCVCRLVGADKELGAGVVH